MNTESQNNNDIREQDLEINLIDIFRLIFVNWYWFVLSVLICRLCFFLFEILF